MRYVGTGSEPRARVMVREAPAASKLCGASSGARAWAMCSSA